MTVSICSINNCLGRNDTFRSFQKRNMSKIPNCGNRSRRHQTYTPSSASKRCLYITRMILSQYPRSQILRIHHLKAVHFIHPCWAAGYVKYYPASTMLTVLHYDKTGVSVHTGCYNEIRSRHMLPVYGRQGKNIIASHKLSMPGFK